MSQEDQQRWDEKWASRFREPFEPHPLLLNHAEFLPGGEALDLACGRGQNAIFLAQHGYRVLGLDISPVALALARIEVQEKGLADRLRLVATDLEFWRPVDASFDLICVFRFLDRRLFPAIRRALRPEGLLFYSTRHRGILRRLPDANQTYLLDKGELLATFGDWDILHAMEGPEEAEIIARKQTVA